MALPKMFSSIPTLPDTFTSTWTRVAISSFGSIGILLVGMYIYWWPYREYTLPFRNLRGPSNGHWFWGQLRGIIKAGPMELHSKWAKEYGATYRYRILFGMVRFFTADPVALSYILGHPDIFPKPEQVRRNMEEILGNGVLVAEGADHKRQRKVLNPSFSAGAVREMVPIFFDKAYDLKDKLLNLIEDELIEASPTPAKPDEEVPGGRKIDVARYLGQCTLDVIGAAGFNYDFQALKEPNNELAEAYREMFSAGQELTVMAILQSLVPLLNRIPTKRNMTVNSSRQKTVEIGRRLVEEKKRAVSAAHGTGLEKGSDIGKDLLSILIKANMAADMKPEQRMSDDEVLAQITTFMLAGNETSSTALSWILYTLCQHPESQERLRKEVMEVDDSRPSLEALNALPYMDNVVREVLRLCPPAPSTIRKSTETVTVPLGTPAIGRDGQTISSVLIPKGTTLFIPIMNINRSLDIWGPDGDEYNPDRYTNMGTDSNAIPGVWGNLLTFLGGGRNCIGYRFALAEIKAILFVLMRSFTFDELASKPVIEKKASIVMRSRVVGEEAAGLQMPLMVKPISA